MFETGEFYETSMLLESLSLSGLSRSLVRGGVALRRTLTIWKELRTSDLSGYHCQTPRTQYHSETTLNLHLVEQVGVT
jgi:hypothetical protein